MRFVRSNSGTAFLVADDRRASYSRKTGDFRGFRTEFMQLFGFNVEGVDYDAEVDPNVALNNLLD